MGSLRKNTVFERRGRDARRSALLEVKSFSMDREGVRVTYRAGEDTAALEWCSVNPVPRLEIGIQQYADDACHIHHRGRAEGMMGQP